MKEYPPCPWCGMPPRSITENEIHGFTIHCGADGCPGNWNNVPETIWYQLCLNAGQLKSIEKQYADSLNLALKENKEMLALLENVANSTPQSWIDSRADVRDRTRIFWATMEVIAWLKKKS